MGRNDSEGKDGDTRVEWVTIPPSIVYTEETKKRTLAVSTEGQLYSFFNFKTPESFVSWSGLHVCKCMSMFI